MLSVVLYGRNDSHGYNLHKRAAISLNAIAELLTDPDDEILFVDYNTPDDLPTFPEAIADTLTEKAVARLRVLRVRPDIHRARFAARTHLVALEPIARNVAIRRANPANKWLLSTNTDMIFCPRREGESLTSIVAALGDGFYHLPRFELPEGLWESLDRKDAPRLICAAREWGERFYLNEITYSGGDNVYDGPGDFQLFLRQDLFDIGGFHEEMIRGWHLDANIARRMRLLRGKVSSALAHLVGYHCDHTRQASAYHKVDRQENDPARFVDEVTEPKIAQQMKTWGLADVAIEEFSLGQASAARYLQGLESAIQGRLAGFLETHYVPEAHGRMGYEADHVLPYLLDLVSSLPPAARIGYVGGRTDTFDKFMAGWRAMGGNAVLVPESAPWLAEAGGVERLPDGQWTDRADLFVFEVGSEKALNQVDFTAEDNARLWAVDQAYKRAIGADLARQAAGAAPRRVLVINGIHNFFEPQVLSTIAMTLTPFSSRIRHGYIVDRGAARVAGASGPVRTAMQTLRALEPLSSSDVKRLSALLARLTDVGPEDPLWMSASRAAAELDACVGSGAIGGDLGSKVMDVLTRLNRERPSVRTAGDAAIDSAAGAGASSRLVRLEDWEDAAWAALAARLFSNRDHAEIFQREVWTWERVTLTQNLMAAKPPGRGAADAGPSVLVCGEHPERLAFVLAQQGYTVDIADPRALATGQMTAMDWREDFRKEGWVSPRAMGLIDERAPEIARGFRYDAVLIVQNGLFGAGRAAAADVLHHASDLLVPGGHLGLAVLTQPLAGDLRLQGHAFPHALAAAGVMDALLADMTDLDLDGTLDWRLTPRSLDRSAEAVETPLVAPPPLMRGRLPELEVVGVLALRKTDRAANWEALRAALDAGIYTGPHTNALGVATSRLFDDGDLRQASLTAHAGKLGSAFESLVPAAGLTRTPVGMTIPAAFGTGIAGVAALGTIPRGSYELEIELRVTAVYEPGAVLAVGVVGRDGLIAQEMYQAQAPGGARLVLPLEVRSESPQGIGVLLKAQGRADLGIVQLVLR
jgi:hypothetical protein